MIKLGYDCGHGLNTAGKRTPDNEREWTFNNTVAVAFADELGKYDGVSLKRFDDTTGKTDVPLQTRTLNANTWGADYFISFHHNAYQSKWGTHTGVETYVYTNPNAKSVALANAVHPALVKGYGLRDRGVKKQNLHMVRETKMPAILVEGGFMDSTIDIKVLRDKAKLQNAGRLIAQAVAKHLNLKLKPVKVEAPKVDAFDVAKVRKTSTETFNATDQALIKKGMIAEIKAAVKDGRFSSKHEDVEKYDVETLRNFVLVALARRK